MTAGPLSGLQIVDLSRVLAGPLCTMLLGDLGADVIKVERPGTGDDTRTWGPPFTHGESAYFLGLNRNKRSLTIDLSSDEGKDILRRMLMSADVLIENFKMGTLAKWGLGEDWFGEHAPGLVRATISGYGSSGPKAGKPGYDFVLQAETGLMAITGESDGRPMKVGVAIVDICTGMMAALSILAALSAKSRSGRGQRVEVNLHDTGLLMLANVASNHLISGEEAQRYGNGHPNIVPYRTYAALDGHVVIAVGNDAQFRVFAELVGHAEWAEDDRFATNAARVRNRVELDARIDEVIGTRDRARWMDLLDEAGVTASRINLISEALFSPQTAGSGMVTEVEHSLAGMLKMLRPPFEFSATPPSIRRAPPTLGQHTDEVLAQLGYDEIDIAALRERGLI